MKIYKCDMCGTMIEYTDCPSINEWVYEVTVNPLQKPNDFPTWEICNDCMRKHRDFLNERSKEIK